MAMIMFKYAAHDARIINSLLNLYVYMDDQGRMIDLPVDSCSKFIAIPQNPLQGCYGHFTSQTRRLIMKMTQTFIL